jgi:arylsulfatase A-like enzyme/thioredoxin-like negative regulator of GroEL
MPACSLYNRGMGSSPERNLRLLPTVGLLLALGCGPSVEIERVVLVTLDTLRADRVGCYGAERAHTPTIDELATKGVRFTTAISPAPVTLPAHASLLTGLDPPRHGVRHNGIFRLPDDVPTLAERFRDAGFATAAAVGAVVLDRQHGLDRGFDHYDDSMSGRTASRATSYAERTADQVVDSVLSWLEGAPERFFLWVHLYDPHADYDPPAGFRAAFPGDPYAGEIAFADSELRRLLETLEQRFGEDSTLVVVTSDHGESLGQHGELSHSLTVYDATQRVPLVMAGPGLPSGLVLEEPVGLVDVAPTLLSLAHLPPFADTSGIDLRQVIAGEKTRDRVHYVETLVPQLDFGWSPLLGVRSPGFKYVRAPRPELYDLTIDPNEMRDLSGERPDLVAELDALVEERLARARESVPLVAPESDHRALLEALGYVVPENATLSIGTGPTHALDPKDGLPIVARLIRGMTLTSEHRFDEALAEMAPLEDGGWFLEVERSRAALGAGRLEAAERYSRAAVALGQGHHTPPYTALGFALERQGRFEDAEAAFEAALARDAIGTDALLGLGRVAVAKGELEPARHFFERAAAGRASSGEARWRLAALLIESGDTERGDALLAQLPARLVASPDASIRLAAAESRAGLPERARRRLREAREAWPHSLAVEEAWTAADSDTSP